MVRSISLALLPRCPTLHQNSKFIYTHHVVRRFCRALASGLHKSDPGSGFICQSKRDIGVCVGGEEGGGCSSKQVSDLCMSF